MLNNIEIQLDTRNIAAYFARLIDNTADLTPLMRSISETLVDEIAENFAQQGRPAWADLADSTKAQRTKDGTWPGEILVRSARLRNSMVGDYDFESAQAGTNVDYAPYLQFGTSKMPARDILPISNAAEGQAELYPSTQMAVEETVLRWLTRLNSENA